MTHNLIIHARLKSQVKFFINILYEIQGEILMKEQTEMIHVRATDKEKEIIEKNAKKYHFRSMSEYIRFLSLNDWEIVVKNKKGE